MIQKSLQYSTLDNSDRSFNTYRNKPKLWRYLNTFFLIIALFGLIYECVFFAFSFWWTDIYIICELLMLTCNCSFLLLKSESQKACLKKRQFLIYFPSIITACLAIILLGLFAFFIKEFNGDDKQQYESNFGMSITLAILIPILP